MMGQRGKCRPDKIDALGLIGVAISTQQRVVEIDALGLIGIAIGTHRPLYFICGVTL